MCVGETREDAVADRLREVRRERQALSEAAALHKLHDHVRRIGREIRVAALDDVRMLQREERLRLTPKRLCKRAVPEHLDRARRTNVGLGAEHVAEPTMTNALGEAKAGNSERGEVVRATAHGRVHAASSLPSFILRLPVRIMMPSTHDQKMPTRQKIARSA